MTQEKLEIIKLKHLKNNLELYNKNRDLIGLYDEYIKNLVELFDLILKHNSDFFYTIVFDILLEIGFFSANRTFNPDKDTFQELVIKPGISIINGEGVCRNVACFYEDIFKNLRKYPLKLCCLDRNGDLNNDTKIYGNHIINLTDYHDIIYGFDIMNHCTFKAINENKLIGLGFEYSLEYRPYGDLLMELSTTLDGKTKFKTDMERKHHLLKMAATYKGMTLDEYEKLIIQANHFIISKIKLFQSFMVQNNDLTHAIKEKMLSLR